MMWLLDSSGIILAIAASLIVGFSFGVLYAHGSEERRERREHKRIIKDIKANKAILPRGRK